MYDRLCYLVVRERAAKVRRSINLFLPCSGSAITLFDLLQVMGVIGGAWIGLTKGAKESGLAGAILGGVLGLVIGYFVGLAPTWVFWVVFDYLGIRKRRTEPLKKRLAKDHGFAFRLIAELVLRGEPAESFWPFILLLLQSDSVSERYSGWENLNIWFPRIAKQIEGFTPHEPTEKCREYVKKVENVQPRAEPLPREAGSDQSDRKN